MTAAKIFNELERSEKLEDQEMEEKALESFKFVCLFVHHGIDFYRLNLD